MPDITLRIAPVPEDPNRPTIDKVKVPNTKVDILYPTAGNVHLYFHQAIQAAFDFDRQQGFNNLSAERAIFSGANISKVRNNLVTDALKGDAEWFWFLDTDMVIEPVTLPRLLCSAQVSGADVIGGLTVMESQDGPIPTIYHLGNFNKNEVTRVLFDYPEGQIVQTAATGTACLLVKRSVFENIQELDPDNPYPWFNESVILGNWVSEDIMFCLKANSAGHPVFVDCTTPVGHAKGRKIWRPSDIRDQSGFPNQKNVAIIPTKSRLDLLRPLVHQLREQGNLEAIIVCDNGSNKTTKNWLESQEDVIVLDTPDIGINKMWNLAANYVVENIGGKRNVNLIFLNNDISIGENFVENLVKTLRSDPVLMAVSANYDGRTISGDYQETDTICGAKYDGTGGFAGFAFAVRQEYFLSGYSFPEECEWWYGDTDLVNMVRVSGGKVGISAKATCEHLDGGGNTGGDATWSDPKWNKMKEDDKKAFVERCKKISQQEKK